MSRLIFIYEKNNFEIKYEKTDSIGNAIKKYIKLLSVSKKHLLFLYKGINILENKIILEKLKNKKKIIIINVIKKDKSINNIENIICPECKDLAFLNINEDNIIKLENCMNKHKNEYSINEFLENQNIDENKIKCNICNNNKSLYNNNFYICTCKKYICQLCMLNHIKNKDHNLLYFNKRYSNCNKHLIEFVSYCSFCNVNLCEICEKKRCYHKNKIILYKKEKLDDKKKKEIKNEIKENISKINEYKNEINQINDSFNNLIKNINEELDKYIKLYNKMIVILNNLTNYQNIKNIINLRNINAINEIKIFLKENIKYKLKYLINKFKIGESMLIYKIKENEKKIKLFGNEFIKNNKGLCMLIIKNREYKLKEYLI